MKIFRNIALMLSSILLTHFSWAQIKQVKFEQLDSLQKAEERPVVVFLHTSWCKYCSLMKNTTLKNKEVEKLLNQKFYFISLDIEEKSDISFRKHTFKYKPTGTTTGVHELAEQLGTVKGKLAYPGICFLNADSEIIYQREGFLSSKAFSYILTNLL
ncbi:MAG: thioredoxin family protein [Chitinophagaceae bacterium]